MTTNNAINLPKVCFNAYLSATQTNKTGDGTAYTIIFDTEINDDGSGYNNSTGVFTAPVTGNYLFNTTVALAGVILQTASLINMTGSAYGIVPFEVGQTNAFNNNIGTGTAIVKMTAGDTMSVVAYSFGSTKTVSVTGGAPASGLTVTSTFSGILLTL